MTDINTRCTCCGLFVADDWLFECSDEGTGWVCGTCVGITDEEYFE